MADIPGESSTDEVIEVGETLTGQLETTGDHDWYRLELTAGKAVTVLLTAQLPLDTYLEIRDSAGNLIRDDVAVSDSTNSRITFTAPATGTYFIDVSAFLDLASGSYQLSVSSYTPLPEATVEEVADFIVEGWMGLGAKAFDAGEGDTITVNLSQLNAEGQFLAQQALALWSDISGIQFATVTVGGQILFDDEDAGAYANIDFVDGTITSGFVNIAKEPTTVDGSVLGTYSFQAYIHEIGHVLGLGHSGPYNGYSVDYLTDASFANDGWPLTVMSYFDQEESVYFSDLGFTQTFYGTPMMADIVAMQTLYGLATTTRADDTVYGFNNSSDRDWYDAELYPELAYTLFDSGGIDTLDYSGFTADQVIRLTQGSFSDVGGLVGNVAVAIGTVIENAIGGSGDDRLIGNSSANRLTGGAGDDVFVGTAAILSGDTITDFGFGDALVFTDASLAGFTYTLSGSTLTYSGGSLSFGSALGGTLVATAAQGGGVQLTLGATPPPVTRAKLILTEPGQDVIVGGNVAVLGTVSGGEVIEVVSGDVTFDASFNAGGDTIVLPDDGNAYSASLSGSFVIIEGDALRVAIPVGVAGLTVQWADGSALLRVDTVSGQVMLGDQVVTAAGTSVAQAETAFRADGDSPFAKLPGLPDPIELQVGGWEASDSFAFG